ncbi:hypothetical protein [Cytobacillus depressus]|uniref:hypothetical protein n=1 Tax=Cytobacillus depressus TaxID=1602942 RepID=UPI001478D7F8|nr:hypothetical protein [Cytobacillus depressus]
MRFVITEMENGKLMVTDTITKRNAYGYVNENGYARANTAIELSIIAKALRQKR